MLFCVVLPFVFFLFCSTQMCGRQWRQSHIYRDPQLSSFPIRVRASDQQWISSHLLRCARFYLWRSSITTHIFNESIMSTDTHDEQIWNALNDVDGTTVWLWTKSIHLFTCREYNKICKSDDSKHRCRASARRVRKCDDTWQQLNHVNKQTKRNREL